jgi:signal transduction histidine kinase
MFFAFKKHKAPALACEKFAALVRLLKESPAHGENFPECLSYIAKLAGARGAALYLHEEKTGFFLLKTWAGGKPTRLTLAEDYEFIKYLRLHGNPALRRDFVSESHELRQTALFFFQQTSSNRVYPVLADERWQALLAVDFEDEERGEEDALRDALFGFYLENLKTWLVTRRLDEKSRKLAEIGHVKNQLLANVTHELQTPLNGILGVAEAILDGSDGPIPSALREHVRLIQKAGRELHSTVNNILKLGHIEAHRNELRLERVSLTSLIGEVAALYRKTLDEKGIEFVIPAEAKACDAFVEPDQIRTVLMNLLGNAVKFTQQGRIAIEIKRNGEMLHVSVADTGIGIDPDKLDLIFEEFYQADGSATRVYGGTGLGLAIVKKIVGLHGGRIWAESQKGYGTKMTFTVPLFPA